GAYLRPGLGICQTVCLNSERAGHAPGGREPSSEGDPQARVEAGAFRGGDRRALGGELARDLAEPRRPSPIGTRDRAQRGDPAALSRRSRGGRVARARARGDVERGPRPVAAGRRGGDVNEGHVVELSLHLRAAPERVFPYLTEPERYARWQGVRAELDPRPGGIYRVWMATGTVAVGEYVEV